jgi:nitrite reductase/ring-hydroxylating ferredoxin subunit
VRVSKSKVFDTGLRRTDLDPERPETFDTPWGSYALYVVEGRPVAAPSFCPHLLGPLFQGTQSGSEVVCPWHGWRFDLNDGRCTMRPEGGESAVPPLEFLVVGTSARGTITMSPPPSAQGE